MAKPRTTSKAAKPLPTSSDAAQRYVCVHGHFYQPPRENPWLETVEVQDSAAPYHDWNDRITAECYAPNGASRIQNKKNEIIRIVNNYARMSFNFGPTLLSWLAEKAPRTYRMVLDADRASVQRYGGHGSALAQNYNHIIMPLASRRDAITQIRWGIADFEHRFGRKPEGMWLAETAVNRDTLDLMAAEGIKFTILAPHQCARIRPVPASIHEGRGGVILSEGVPSGNAAVEGPAVMSSAERLLPTEAAEAANTPDATATDNQQPTTPWTPTPNATVDTTRAYRVPLNQGRSIAVFFYNGPTSRAIAFEGLLNSGEDFARRLLAVFKPPVFSSDPNGNANSNNNHSNNNSNGDLPRPQLSHVATDGESYGHHHRHGEMALSYAMHWIEDNGFARITNFAEFLELHPPEYEAEVAENTSWSCAHGIERWRSNCGCNSGKLDWNQKWRAPLREALDLLRDASAPLAEALAKPLLKDLWAARDAYIHVVLDRSPASTARFFDAHALHPLDDDQRTTILELFELLRHSQLMYTSCGWFFDEISGIETIQIIAYAGRVLQLAAKLFGPPGEALEARFLEVLARAKSNLPEIGDGAQVYARYVTPMRIGLEQVGAHYAISSIFRAYPEDGELFCFTLHRDSQESFTSGRGKVALGRAHIRSRITEETEEICFAVLHLGDQNLSAAVRRYSEDNPENAAAFQAFSGDIRNAIRRANLPEVIRLIDRFFGALAYSLTSLFADEQHRILRTILDRTLAEMEDSLRKIYEDHASLLRFLTESGMAAPPALAIAANFALNASLRRAIEADDFDPAEIDGLLARAAADQVTLDTSVLSFAAGQRMKWAMVKLESATDANRNPEAALHTALTIAATLRAMPFEVTLWQAQNIWNDLYRRSDKNYLSAEWTEGFHKLGEALNIAVDQLVIDEGVSAF